MKAASAVIVLLLGSLIAPMVCAAQNQQQVPQPPPGYDQAQAPQPGPYDQGQAPQQAPPMSADQLQQLVAPIALYPDSLVAQILAASTYPTQIVEANRWLVANQGLEGQALADAVNQQPWDPSVKALTQFPSVLANMNQNLSWTQALGDAYYNQPQDVMNAIQVMRQKAEAAGNLRSGPQQVVTNNGPDIVIQPANPEIVYVPTYDPWVVYGPPIPVWPGFVFGGIWVGQPFWGWGIGINIGFFRPYPWGWHAWGFNWGAHGLYYGGRPWAPRGPAFFNHGVYAGPAYRASAPGYRGNPGYRPSAPAYRGTAPGYRPSGPASAYHAPVPAYHAVEPSINRGFGPAQGNVSGMHSGAFSGYAHGGVTQGYASRGAASMGGFHGGGGGFHGGGGGGRR